MSIEDQFDVAAQDRRAAEAKAKPADLYSVDEVLGCAVVIEPAPEAEVPEAPPVEQEPELPGTDG